MKTGVWPRNDYPDQKQRGLEIDTSIREESIEKYTICKNENTVDHEYQVGD